MYQRHNLKQHDIDIRKNLYKLNKMNNIDQDIEELEVNKLTKLVLIGEIPILMRIPIRM